MKIRRKVEMVIEQRQIEIVTTREQRTTTSWCPVCAAAIPVVNSAETTEVGDAIAGNLGSELADVMARKVYASAKSGRFHFAQHWPVRVFRLFRRHKENPNKYLGEPPPL